MDSLDLQALTDLAYSTLQNASDFALQKVEAAAGYWHGEVKCNVAITSEYICLRQALGLSLDGDRDAYRKYLLSEQNSDGSWSLAPGLPGDVSVTTEAYLALKILGMSVTGSRQMQLACDSVRSMGGVAKVRILTRIYLATLGLFPWTAIPQLPAEVILLPVLSPINIYRFAYWIRVTLIPILIICHHRPTYRLPNGVSADNDFLDELWLDPTNKAVPYCSPLLQLLLQANFVAFVFTLVDKVLGLLGCLRWREERNGDWTGIYQPMHLNLFALLLEGFKMDDDPIRLGLEALERFAWQDEGGKRMQTSVSPIWDTALMTIGLCESGLSRGKGTELGDCLDRAVQWLESQQRLGPEGDWRVYRPGLTPGAFSFQFSNSWYPDVDNTAIAVIALITHDARAATSPAVTRAQEWILGMQNADGGWGTFDVENNALYLNRIPFSDMDSMCDPSIADVTGHVLEAFGLLLRATEDSIKHDANLTARTRLAAHRAIGYLARTQEPCGAWFGRWGTNYIYGTCTVVCGVGYFQGRDAGVPKLMQSATSWLRSVQNLDGGWGESLLSYADASLAGRGLHQRQPRPLRWLVSAQTMAEPYGGQAAALWAESGFTGTGFPNHFYLGYTLSKEQEWAAGPGAQMARR
ncbi:hypothetical protein ACCO45_007426 [Purpureocillium lilacinum]|uniref:Uncharacterized protein n=1 Tax=Purpureocillium lilacinum TaxID=33203 RepID=A0ACC4DUL3_PURLI